MNESKHIYLTLDGMRGIAALSVLVMHLDLALGSHMLPHAYLAVDMFFVMSGVVIAHAYEHRFRSGMKAAEFIRLRLIRLFPLYLLGTVITMLGVAAALFAGIGFAGWTPANLAMVAVPSLLMLPAYAADIPSAYPLNPPAWSLFFELVANLVYVLLFPYMRSRVLLTIAAVSALGLVTITMSGHDLNLGVGWSAFYAGIPRVFWSFPLGVLIYRHKDRLPKPSIPPIVLCLATVAIFAPHFPRPVAIVWDIMAVIVLLPAVCIAAISNEPRRGTTVMLWLGGISYPIYILQFGMYKVYENFIKIAWGQDPANLAPWPGVFFLVLALAASTIFDRLYDRPVRRFIGRRRARSSRLAAID